MSPLRLPSVPERFILRIAGQATDTILRVVPVVLLARPPRCSRRLTAPAGKMLDLEHRRHAESNGALERRALEFQAQFAGAAPGGIEFRVRRPAGNLGVFVSVLGARRIAEIV